MSNFLFALIPIIDAGYDQANGPGQGSGPNPEQPFTKQLHFDTDVNCYLG